MANKLARILLAGGLLSVLVGCTEEHGPLRTERRDLVGFESIDMEGTARLEIQVGAATSVELEAASASLDRVSTQVREGTLYIESRPKDWLPNKGRPRVTVRVTVPKLIALRLGGGNDVRLSGFSGGHSSIKVEGAANIDGTGMLDRFAVHMAGAGHADFSSLVANDVHVTVDGVGSVTVNAAEVLDATMNGIGAIFYLGTPREVSTRMNGLGTIAKRDSTHGSDAERQSEIDPDSLQPEYEDGPRVESETGKVI